LPTLQQQTTQERLSAEIAEAFSEFIKKAEDIKTRVVALHDSPDGCDVELQNDQFLTIKDATDAVELIAKQLIMAAYFTANYKSCMTRADSKTSGEWDVSILDRYSPKGVEFERRETEKKRKLVEEEEARKRAKEEEERQSAHHVAALFLVDEAPPKTPLKYRRRNQAQSILDRFKEDLLSRYKALHGVEDSSGLSLPGVPMRLSTVASVTLRTHTVKRTELLAAMNELLEKFKFKPIDKRDALWTDWFLKEFIGLDAKDIGDASAAAIQPSPHVHKPITVIDTPERKAAVYGHAIRHISEVAEKVLRPSLHQS